MCAGQARTLPFAWTYQEPASHSFRIPEGGVFSEMRPHEEGRRQ